jgi:predicted  nucleic acid-binding Zn-ribbon protein
VRLTNLDKPEATAFANKSVEDIAETIQGAGEQTRSERYKDMMAAAAEYYRALEQSAAASSDTIRQLKDKLDELASRFSDDPAYHAILKVEREARQSQNGVPHAPG